MKSVKSQQWLLGAANALDILFLLSLYHLTINMAPHPIPKIYPTPTPEIQERLKRRLQTPKAMAPAPRARKIQVLSWAVSLCKYSS
ncbi:uncharacterized protein EV154DRAFT_522598 [Mucor mucedo]|uniref:uncharacterized protein n=1 Tax=Mucor mucedo TaxID=29922 RepID=UPI00221F017C|nr:uncharacterized protein EV154DRAFT_522598 [Mucor mucedo]KAI7883852.1 hypothetical protein EV154DRAFT_522598 [Mucor mucedo]